MAGEYKVTLDKERTLKFGIRDVRELETSLGYGVDELERRGQRMTALIALLFYGLRHEDASLTMSLVEKRLQRYIDKGGDSSEVAGTVYSALYASGVYGKRMVDVSRQVDAELGRNGDGTGVTADEEADGEGPLRSSASPSGGVERE